MEEPQLSILMSGIKMVTKRSQLFNKLQKIDGLCVEIKIQQFKNSVLAVL